VSRAPGLIVASESLQSLPQRELLQHSPSACPSPSRSTPPVVDMSQSSSWPSSSQTSAFPGKRDASSSSQSSPPQTIRSCPSPSASPSSHSAPVHTRSPSEHDPTPHGGLP